MPTHRRVRDEWGTGLETGLLRRGDGAKETVSIVSRTAGEEELIGRSVGGGTLAELNGPELVYLDGLASGVAKRPQELARVGIEGVDSTPRGIVADEDRVAHWAEVGGSLCDAPG